MLGFIIIIIPSNTNNKHKPSNNTTIQIIIPSKNERTTQNIFNFRSISLGRGKALFPVQITIKERKERNNDYTE